MGTAMDLTNKSVIAQVRTHKLVCHRDDLGHRNRRVSREVATTFLVRVPLDDADFATVDPTAAWAEPVAQAGAWADAVVAEALRTGYVPTITGGTVTLGATEWFDNPDHEHILYQYEGALEVVAKDGDAGTEAWVELIAAVRRSQS